MKIEAVITGLLLGVSLCSSLYLGQSEYPYRLVGIKFCPQTSNKFPRYGKEFSKKSQQKLDKKYCAFEYKLLKQVWQKKQFETNKPLPESSLIIRELPFTESDRIYFLLAPISAGAALLSWAKKAEKDELSAHHELEKYKTLIKISTTDNQRERDFKTGVINQTWDDKKIVYGLTSIDAIKEQYEQKKELIVKHHKSTLKQFDLANSEADKHISENLLDKHKAEKEIAKLQNKNLSQTNVNQPSDKQLVNSLIEALKSHEDGWLYSIIKNAKPLWLIGSQGSGKTNTAGAIALIRKYCFDAPIYQLIDRHATGENWEVWKLLDATLKAESEEEIGQALYDATDRWLQRIKEKPSTKQQIIIDEFTNLKKIDSCKEAAMKFFSMHLTDTRKAKEYFIGVNHYFTNESTVEGTFEARKSGTIQLKKFSANGETPLSRVQIVHGLVDDNGNELEEVERTLPVWLEANKIYGHFNGNPINFEG